MQVLELSANKVMRREINLKVSNFKKFHNLKLVLMKKYSAEKIAQ